MRQSILKYAAILQLSLLMTACYFPTRPEMPDAPIVVHQFITKKIPTELLDIPDVPTAPNLDGTQKGVALWLIENEKRIKVLENQINKIKDYNE